MTKNSFAAEVTFKDWPSIFPLIASQLSSEWSDEEVEIF